jgi:hypothetical protein
VNGDIDQNVAGLVQEADTSARPRVAWRFNLKSLRIEKLSPDSMPSLRCAIEVGGDDVD